MLAILFDLYPKRLYNKIMFKAIVGYIYLDRFSSGADSFNGQSIARKNNKAASQMLPNAYDKTPIPTIGNLILGRATLVWG
jgi:hypothetical protein